MPKIKIPKIKFDRELTWHLTLLVFFVFFVVVFALSVYSFSRMKKELGAEISEVSFSPLVLRNDLLEQSVAEIEEKQAVFENIISSKPDIKDPFGVEETETEEEL